MRQQRLLQAELVGAGLVGCLLKQGIVHVRGILYIIPIRFSFLAQ